MAKRRKVLNDVLSNANASKDEFKIFGPESLKINDLANRLENQEIQIKDPNYSVSNDGPRMNRELSSIAKDQKKVKEDISKYVESSPLKKAIQRNKFVKSKVREAKINEDINSKLSESKKSVEKEQPKQGSALVNATNPTENTSNTNPNIDANINWDEPYEFPYGKNIEEGQKIERARADKAWQMQGIKYDSKGDHVFPDGTPANYDMFKGRYLIDNTRKEVAPTPEENIQNGQKLIETISSDVNNTVTDKAILAQIENAESPEEIEKIKADAEAAKIEEQKQKEELANQNKSAVQTTMNVINEDLKGKRPAFDQVTTVQDIQKGVFDQYRNQASNVPYAVVEKLGIQDYYPNAGRDIAVGTFSGSRIGSQTIYSGAGSLLPMGLYDARKRSLLEAAKAVQKKKDEFLQIPDAPRQFDAEFKQAAYSSLYDIGASHNWDINAIMKDKEAMQKVYSIQAKAKELAYTDEIVNQVFESLNPKDGKPAAYVPEDILQDMIDYRKGKLDVESVLSGDSDVLEIAGRIRNYANGIDWAQKNLPQWKSDPVSLPLNLRTDKEITMENLNELNQAFEKAKISGDYNSYMTATKEYFHLDPKVVDAWVEQSMVGATPEQKQKVVDDLNTYIIAQMPPESIKLKIENLKNDALGWSRLAFDKQKDKEEKETIITRAINTAKDAKLKDMISAINNDASLNTTEKKAAALTKAYRDAGMTPTYNKRTGEVYGVVKYTAADKKMNVVYPSNTTQVWVQKQDGGMAWVNISSVLANQGSYKLTKEQKTELSEFQKGGARGSINESRMYETYVDDKGYTRKVGTNNIDKYSSTTKERKRLGTETVGNVVIASKDKDGNVTYKPGTMQIRAQFNPEINPTDRDALDAMFADEKQKLSTDPTFNAAGPASNF